MNHRDKNIHPPCPLSFIKVLLFATPDFLPRFIFLQLYFLHLHCFSSHRSLFTFSSLQRTFLAHPIPSPSKFAGHDSQRNNPIKHPQPADNRQQTLRVLDDIIQGKHGHRAGSCWNEPERQTYLI